MHLLTPGLGLFVWTLVAFLAVFFLLRKFAWKPILGMLTEREKGIADSIAMADKVRKEMAQLKSENEVLLAKAREERAQLLKEAKDAKDKIIADAKEEAKTHASKIIDEAYVQIENKKNAAIVDVKNQIGKLSLEVAEKIMRKDLANGNNHQEYVKTLAEDIQLN